MNQSPISGRKAALLVGFCAVAMLALTVLYAFAPELRNQTSDQANALSRSAVGFAGLQEYLNDAGIPARLDRNDGSQVQPSLTILTPPAGMSPNEIRAFVPQSPVLIVLDKWLALPLPDHPDWVQRILAYPAETMQAQATGLLPRAKFVRAKGDGRNIVTTAGGRGALAKLGTPVLGHVEQLQTLQGAAALLSVGKNAVLARGGVLIRRGQPLKVYPFYVLSDPDILNNRGLADPANAAAAIAIISALRAGNGPVAMDVTLNGLGKSPSLLRAAFAPPFLGATLCALLAALLMGLHAAVRFGPALVPARIFARGKGALADNSAALVKMMGREAAMAPRYVSASRTLVLERLGARRLAPAQQRDLVARLERGGESYEQLAAEAAGARTGGDLLTVARKTFAWRRRISGGNQ